MQSITLDDNVVGYTLFFHPSSFSFPIPPNFVQPGSLIAAILPWFLTPQQMKNTMGSSWTDLPSPLPPLLEEKRWDLSLRANPKFHHALRALSFPKELYEFISQREKLPYIIWAEVNPISKKMGMEVRLLDEALKQTKAQRVPESAQCRIVFVHLDALKTLHRLPSLSQRRSQQHEVSFYMFGIQEGTSRRTWTVEEIYPCGSSFKQPSLALFSSC